MLNDYVNKIKAFDKENGRLTTTEKERDLQSTKQ